MKKEYWYLGLAIVLAIVIMKYGNKITSMASAGNPNYPPSQINLDTTPGYGPQGPNDGSNNYSGSGSFKFPW